MSHDHYENPLITRYASKEMSHLWGAQKKFGTWRRLWVAEQLKRARRLKPGGKAQRAASRQAAYDRVRVARELLTEVTGEPLNPRHFKAHLERRYLGK